MEKSYAEGLASGYAWASEDHTGVKTATPGNGTGSFEFSQAYARGCDDYNAGRRGSMHSVQDAYAHWQNSGGRSIFARGDLTLSDAQRAQLRELWPTFMSGDNDTSAYYEAQQAMQDAAWAALDTPAAGLNH